MHIGIAGRKNRKDGSLKVGGKRQERRAGEMECMGEREKKKD